MARVKRVALLALIALLTMNIWTGGPLLAVWLGSRVQGEGPPSMGAVGVVAVSLIAISVVLVRILGRLDVAYDRMVGRRSARQQLPWHKSMRGERWHAGEEGRVRPVDAILVWSVVLAVVVFEAWFFFFSGSPLSNG